MRPPPKGVKHPMEDALAKHAQQPASQKPSHPNKAIESSATPKSKQTSTTIKKARNP